MNRVYFVLFITGISFITLYIISFVIIYFGQERIIFQRSRLAPDFHYSYAAEELTLTTIDHIQLNALLFKSVQDTVKGLILYFHGNRHTLEQWGWNALFLTGQGYDVLMIDYRGYGKSTGDPTEQGLYHDADATLKWANQHYPSTPLVYYGRSLGSGVATYLATKHMPMKLVLETPYDELKNAVPWYLRGLLNIIPLRHNFRNNERLPYITCPILILHGSEDGIVPLSSALGLKPLLKPGDRFLVIRGGRHNNLKKFAEARNTVIDFLK